MLGGVCVWFVGRLCIRDCRARCGTDGGCFQAVGYSSNRRVACSQPRTRPHPAIRYAHGTVSSSHRGALLAHPLFQSPHSGGNFATSLYSAPKTTRLLCSGCPQSNADEVAWASAGHGEGRGLCWGGDAFLSSVVNSAVVAFQSMDGDGQSPDGDRRNGVSQLCDAPGKCGCGPAGGGYRLAEGGWPLPVPKFLARPWGAEMAITWSRRAETWTRDALTSSSIWSRRKSAKNARSPGGSRFIAVFDLRNPELCTSARPAPFLSQAGVKEQVEEGSPCEEEGPRCFAVESPFWAPRPPPCGSSVQRSGPLLPTAFLFFFP